LSIPAARPAAPPAGPTAAYGAYLAQTGGCVGCHGPGLSGGRMPGARPNGSELDPFMPWRAAGQMTDDEIRALWLDLQSVPPKATGGR
jgi:hypothetical protein